MILSMSKRLAVRERRIPEPSCYGFKLIGYIPPQPPLIKIPCILFYTFEPSATWRHGNVFWILSHRTLFVNIIIYSGSLVRTFCSGRRFHGRISPPVTHRFCLRVQYSVHFFFFPQKPHPWCRPIDDDVTYSKYAPVLRRYPTRVITAGHSPKWPTPVTVVHPACKRRAVIISANPTKIKKQKMKNIIH